MKTTTDQDPKMNTSPKKTDDTIETLMKVINLFNQASKLIHYSKRNLSSRGSTKEAIMLPIVAVTSWGQLNLKESILGIICTLSPCKFGTIRAMQCVLP